MATRYFLSIGTAWNDNANWSTTSGGGGGASFPTSADDAIFDVNSGNCTLTAAAACLSLKIGDAASAYAGTLDLATFALAIGTGGLDCTDGGSATLDLGTGSHSCSGPFDIADVGTLTPGTADVTLTGTNTFTHAESQTIDELIIDGTITKAGGNVLRVNVFTINVTREFIINSNGTIRDILGGLSFTNAGTLSGAADIFLISSDPGVSTLVNNGAITLPTLNVYNNWTVSGTGTFDSSTNTLFRNNTTGTTLTLGSNLAVTGPVEFVVDAGETYIVDNTGNWNLTLSGNLTFTDNTTGTLTWTKGSGEITLSGAANQVVATPTGWTQVLEDIVINKSAGKVTLAGDVYSDSFTGTDGEFDPAGNAVDVTGNCDWAAAFTMVADANAMNGCTWEVDGNFTCDGQTLNATAEWFLNVTGTAVASGAGAVAWCTAGVTDITSSGWIDNGNNENWREFSSSSSLGFSSSSSSLGFSSSSSLGFSSSSVSSTSSSLGFSSSSSLGFSSSSVSSTSSSLGFSSSSSLGFSSSSSLGFSSSSSSLGFSSSSSLGFSSSSSLGFSSSSSSLGFSSSSSSSSSLGVSESSTSTSTSTSLSSQSLSSTSSSESSSSISSYSSGSSTSTSSASTSSSSQSPSSQSLSSQSLSSQSLSSSSSSQSPSSQSLSSQSISSPSSSLSSTSSESSTSSSSMSESSSSGLVAAGLATVSNTSDADFEVHFYRRRTNQAFIHLEITSGQSVGLHPDNHVLLKIGKDGTPPVIDLDDTAATANGSFITKTNPMLFRLHQDDAVFAAGIYDFQVSVLDDAAGTAITLLRKGRFVLFDSVGAPDIVE